MKRLKNWLHARAHERAQAGGAPGATKDQVRSALASGLGAAATFLLLAGFCAHASQAQVPPAPALAPPAATQGRREIVFLQKRAPLVHYMFKGPAGAGWVSFALPEVISQQLWNCASRELSNHPQLIVNEGIQLSISPEDGPLEEILHYSPRSAIPSTCPVQMVYSNASALLMAIGSNVMDPESVDFGKLLRRCLPTPEQVERYLNTGSFLTDIPRPANAREPRVSLPQCPMP